MTVRYLDLADYLAVAAAVTGADIRTIITAADLNLADSALHAPAAGFADTERYPTLTEKAAVLICRLAWNHPLPDGNKRAVWASLRMFLAGNNAAWKSAPGLDEASRPCLPSPPASGRKIHSQLAAPPSRMIQQTSRRIRT